MENSNPILAELRAVSPTVAEISRNHPFVVPKGYFERFAEEVLVLLKEPEFRVLGAAIQTPYTVETGYFENLAERMSILVKGEALSDLLAGPVKSPYKIPQGYFESLADNILAKVQTEYPITLGDIRKNPYQIPEGYFEGLADQLLKKAKEEDSIPVSLGAKELPFEVPAGYFEGFAEKMLTKVMGDSLPEILKGFHELPYAVPQGYFENFSSKQLELVKAQESVTSEDHSTPQSELAELSPVLSDLFRNKKMQFAVPEGYFAEAAESESTLLASISKESLYEVPAGYFENFPVQMLEKVSKKKAAKVITGSFGRSWVKYAAAAVVLGALITSALLIFNPGKTNTEIAGNSGSATEVQKKLQETSDDALFSYLDDQNLSYVDPATATDDEELDQEAVKTLLADVSDAAIEAYLDQETDDRKPLTN